MERCKDEENGKRRLPQGADFPFFLGLFVKGIVMLQVCRWTCNVDWGLEGSSPDKEERPMTADASHQLAVSHETAGWWWMQANQRAVSNEAAADG